MIGVIQLVGAYIFEQFAEPLSTPTTGHTVFTLVTSAAAIWCLLALRVWRSYHWEDGHASLAVAGQAVRATTGLGLPPGPPLRPKRADIPPHLATLDGVLASVPGRHSFIQHLVRRAARRRRNHQPPTTNHQPPAQRTAGRRRERIRL